MGETGKEYVLRNLITRHLKRLIQTSRGTSVNLSIHHVLVDRKSGTNVGDLGLQVQIQPSAYHKPRRLVK